MIFKGVRHEREAFGQRGRGDTAIQSEGFSVQLEELGEGFLIGFYLVEGMKILTTYQMIEKIRYYSDSYFIPKQNSFPVAKNFEEQRIRIMFSIICSDLNIESIFFSSKKLKNT